MAAPRLAGASSDLSRGIKKWEGGRQVKMQCTHTCRHGPAAGTLIRMLTNRGTFQNLGLMENELRNSRVGMG